jgi:hypothetical protein
MRILLLILNTDLALCEPIRRRNDARLLPTPKLVQNMRAVRCQHELHSTRHTVQS